MEKAKMEGAVSAAGPSLLELLWEDLDRVISILMTEDAPSEKPPLPSAVNRKHPIPQWRDEWMAWGETRGQAQGLAFAIALIEQPYNPSVPGVKERAMERWAEANAE